MDSLSLGRLEREYTLSQINYKRAHSELNMKKRQAERLEREIVHRGMMEHLVSPTLGFEVENFKLFGRLRKTETEIHNTIPSNETVTAERDYIQFDKIRKAQPQEAKYIEFYGCIKDEAGKPRTPRSPAAFATSGIDRTESRALSRARSRVGSQGRLNLIPTPSRTPSRKPSFSLYANNKITSDPSMTSSTNKDRLTTRTFHQPTRYP